MPEDGTNPTPSDENLSPDPSTSVPPSGPPETPPDPLQTTLAGDDVPAWAQGMSVKDMLQTAQGAIEALRTHEPSPAPATPPQAPQGYAQPQPMNQPWSVDFYDDNAATAIDQRIEQRAAEIAQRQIDAAVQQFAPALGAVGQIARSQVASQPAYKEVFQKWGHEVDMFLKDIPQAQRTMEVYSLAADAVRGRHVDDLVAARLASQPASGSVSVDPSMAPPPDEPVYEDPVDEFWASNHEWVRRAKDQGITKSMFRDQARAMRVDPKVYIESIKKGPATYTTAGVTRTFGQ